MEAQSIPAIADVEKCESIYSSEPANKDGAMLYWCLLAQRAVPLMLCELDKGQKH